MNLREIYHLYFRYLSEATAELPFHKGIQEKSYCRKSHFLTREFPFIVSFNEPVMNPNAAFSTVSTSCTRDGYVTPPTVQVNTLKTKFTLTPGE